MPFLRFCLFLLFPPLRFPAEKSRIGIYAYSTSRPADPAERKYMAEDTGKDTADGVYSINEKFRAPRAADITEELRNTLNAEQYEAVTAPSGPLLVIAGAGTGKTTVLTNRIAYMAASGTPPEAILALTFTNKAAREMKQRIAAILNPGGGGDCAVKACTYHSFCVQELRKYSAEVGLGRNFTVIDQGDAADAVNLMKETWGFGKDRTFPKGREIVNILSECSNTGCTLSSCLEDGYPQYVQHTQGIAEIGERYADYKKERNLADYDDLLTLFLGLLRSHPDIKQYISDTYREILVDEYQDSNILQMEILKELRSCGNSSVTVVGDDFQSIYGFRGSEVKNILNFPDMWENCRTVILRENYRSNQKILDFSNAVTEGAEFKYTKDLRGNRTDGIKPTAVYTDSQDTEARFILSKAADLHGAGIPYGRMAAIIRGSNDSLQLEKLLTQYRMPFQKFGGLKFLERRHVKDTLAFLKVWQNPSDEISWFRVFQLYPNIGSVYAKRISDAVKACGIGVLTDGTFAGKRYAPYLAEIDGALKHLQGAVLTEQLDWLTDYRHGLTERIINGSARNSTAKTDGLRQNDADLKDSKLLIDMAAGYSDALSFLTDMTLEAPVPEDADDVFNITTVHSAKGLEYDAVFIVCCCDGTFPWDKPAKADTPGALAKKHAEDEEERRIFYVAATRAKTHLYMTVPKRIFKNGEVRMTEPSRFLTEDRVRGTYGTLSVRQ